MSTQAITQQSSAPQGCTAALQYALPPAGPMSPGRMLAACMHATAMQQAHSYVERWLPAAGRQACAASLASLDASTTWQLVAGMESCSAQGAAAATAPCPALHHNMPPSS